LLEKIIVPVIGALRRKLTSGLPVIQAERQYYD